MTPPVPPLAHLLNRFAPDAGLIPDAELLHRYAERRDEAAFELLLWRHGTLVWGVCRRVAHDRTAAEDAFQAAALALARHAGSVRRGESIAGWLYRVAYRAALRTRSRWREELVAVPPERSTRDHAPADAAAAHELAGVIDEEVSGLPDAFRAAFVLCELEGRSNAEAAAALGCAVGTVESRLTRARLRLRDRLARRGVALSIGALAVSAVPASVRAAAARAVTEPCAISPAVRELAAHAARASRAGYVVAGFALVAGVALAVGIVAAARVDAPAPQAKTREPAPAAKADAATLKRLGSGRFRHSGVVFHAAFSPDGKTLATAALGSVGLWEVGTGKLVRRVERANTPFHRVAFAADGKTIHAVVGPLQGGCDLLSFDASTGKELASVPVRNAVYRNAEFSRDGARLAVYSMQELEAIILDPKAAKELARVPAYFEGNTLSPDGKTLVVAGGEKTVRLIDTATGKDTGKLAVGDRRPEWARFLSPTEAILAGRNWVERRNLKENATAWKEDFLGSGTGVEVSADGNRVAHVSASAVTLFDAVTGEELIPRQSRIGGTSARFSPDSTTLAITTAAGTVVLLDATTGGVLPQSADLVGIVGGLTFSADGRYLFAVPSGAGMMRDRWLRWDLSAAEPKAEPLEDFVTLSPDGRVGMRPDTFYRPDSPAEFVDPVTGKRVARLDPPETGDTVVISRADFRRGLFSGDGKRFVGFRLTPRNAGAGQTELGLATWDTATGRRLTQRDPEKAKKEQLFPLAVSPDGKAVAVTLAEGPEFQFGRKFHLGLWEPDGDKMRWTRERGMGQMFVAFADGGSKLIMQEFHTPRLLLGPSVPIPPGPYPFVTLDAATGKELAKANGPDLGQPSLVFTGEPGFNAIPNARAVSPDGKTMAISGWDGTIHVWDLAGDREWAKFAHPGPVHELAFAPDGKALAAASLATPVIVYDLATKP
jgi:RNA polymerase sigma factor (sigma-70 family)